VDVEEDGFPSRTLSSCSFNRSSEAKYGSVTESAEGKTWFSSSGGGVFEFLLAECSLAVIEYSVLSKSVHTDDPERQLINSRDETSGYPVSAGHGESVFQTSTFLVFLIIGSALPWTLVTLP
jgi:hypothetical protein